MIYKAYNGIDYLLTFSYNSYFRVPIEWESKDLISYVTDAAKAAVDILDAPKEKIQMMNYNVAGIPPVISARETEAVLKKRYPDFKVEYKMSTDPRRMPRAMAVFDDSFARKEWGWSPVYSTPEAVIERFEKDVKEHPRRYGLGK